MLEPPGDLYLTLHVRRTRSSSAGQRSSLDLPVTLPELVLGASSATPDGR
jgi:hypothetical protein